MATSQRKARIAGNHQKQEERQGKILFYSLQKEDDLVNTLISNFQPPEPKENRCMLSHSVMSNSVTHGLQPAKFFSPWDSPDKNTAVGSHALLQGVFPTQGSTPGLLHYRRILNCLSQQGRTL